MIERERVDPHDLDRVAAEVWRRCLDDGFGGWDPYDGLKSRMLKPFLGRSRLLRLAVIQGVKRSPINLRPMLRVTRGRNPKGMALLLHAISRLPRLVDLEHRTQIAEALAALASRPDGSPLISGRRPGPITADLLADPALGAVGWGYDFPWQARAFYQQAYYPTVVVTNFVVDAFAAAELPYAGAVARAAAAFVQNHLHRHADKTGCCYSYSPQDCSRVFNASLFAGKILARASLEIDNADRDSLREEAARTVDYVVARQRSDGGWVYGEAPHWQWIDNLHTGFVLETMADIARMVGQPERWSESLAKGLVFYRSRLLGSDATPFYYADRPWPLDSHTVAQSALTLLAFCDRDPGLAVQARRVLEIGIERLYDPSQCGFWHQRGRYLANRTVFLRWSQAWMLHALCAVLAHEERLA